MKVLVVGLGNALRGDDAAGLAVARQAESRLRGVADVRVHPGEPVDLIERWRAFDAVVLVDAARGRAGRGGVRRYEYGRDRLPAGEMGTSSHAFDLLVAIELAGVLGALPRTLVLYAVEGERFSLGDEPSEAIRRAIDEAVELVCADVRRYVAMPSPGSIPDAGAAGDGGTHA